jgi:hypothetical protein
MSESADINQKNSLPYYCELEYKRSLEYYTDVCTRKEKWNNTALGRDFGNIRDTEITSERQLSVKSRG